MECIDGDSHVHDVIRPTHLPLSPPLTAAAPAAAATVPVCPPPSQRLPPTSVASVARRRRPWLPQLPLQAATAAVPGCHRRRPQPAPPPAAAAPVCRRRFLPLPLPPPRAAAAPSSYDSGLPHQADAAPHSHRRGAEPPA